MARLERHRGYLFGKLETIEKILIFIRIISLTQESGIIGPSRDSHAHGFL